MKKIFVLLSSALLAVSAGAQDFVSGDNVLGANVGFGGHGHKYGYKMKYDCVMLPLQVPSRTASAVALQRMVFARSLWSIINTSPSMFFSCSSRFLSIRWMARLRYQTARPNTAPKNAAGTPSAKRMSPIFSMFCPLCPVTLR